ncbi:MAG: hypothetical protein ACLFUL_11675 [Desulfobacteraceae bacterium]
MSFRIWLIILFLAMGDIFLGLKAVRVWSDGEKALPETENQKSTPPPVNKMVKREMIPEAEYEVIAKKDLFRPHRSEVVKEPPGKEPTKEKAPDKRLLKALQETVKRISVYGVMMVNGEKKALIKNPVTPVLGDKRNKAQPPHAGEAIKWVKAGDAVNRFTVKEIKPTGVVLKAEGIDFDIVLYDEDKPKQRASEKRATGPVVIDTGKGPEAESPPQKPEGPEEKVLERKLPLEAGQKAPVSEDATQKSEPQKR